MKKVVCLALTLLISITVAVPAMAKMGGKYEAGVYSMGIYFDGETIPSGQHNGINIENNSNVKIDGAVKIISSNFLRINENSTLTITENGSLSGNQLYYEYSTNSKIVLKNGAWIKVNFNFFDAADNFELLLQASGITYTRNDTIIMAGDVPACEHKNLQTVCTDCGEVISTYTGSMISEGNVSIIVGIACAVAFGIGGLFLGKTIEKKKKKTALASSANNEVEE